MLLLQTITYSHPNKDILFENIDLTVNKQDKVALIGNNGIGKSTLLQIIAGNLQPSGGFVRTASRPYYIPQLFGQFNDHTIARALAIEDKLTALREILAGNVTEANLAVLDDDWAIEERCNEALSHWKLDGLDLAQKLGTLSGGQKTKVFLSGIIIHQPQIVLLDEPSNHLDMLSRGILYDYIRTTPNTLVVVSHDRTLLNLLNIVCELGRRGVTLYGGNYDFYAEQKAIEASALNEELRGREKALRKAKEVERESLERQQRLDARGKKKQEKAGLPTISMNTFRNNAEKSTSRLKDVHAEKVGGISQEVDQLRKELPGKDKMKIDLDDSALHRGKILITARDINYGYETRMGGYEDPVNGYEGRMVWERPLSFQLTSGQRIAIKGVNGSGKTTLIRIILGELQPVSGTIHRADAKAIYIDQDYSLIDNRLTVYEQAVQFNSDNLPEHELKSRLTHFLFTKAYWDKRCEALSGGEKMRLILCCLMVRSQAPDIIILDEPTNNLDIQNTEILTAAINEYKGTIVVVSHDAYFLEQIKVEEAIELITFTER